ncbi:MAG: succinyl-diaminopimelate desuccinylase [Acidimicrobiia bacterium]|nr:succinyl-diaminopimelate desuccinylase [Acidimicrobiia bacterium]
MTAIHDTLAELVSIHSVTGNEGRLCTAVAQRLLKVWTMQGVTRIGNALVVGQQTGRPLLTLYGHFDTVPVQDNGEPVVRDGRMFGLGTVDMKSGLAIMIHLLEDDAVRTGPYDVVGVFYDKEEGPMAENGLEAVLDKVPWLADSEFAIVLEPTDLGVELGCNGAMNADVVFEGKAAHSARPWLGENAVTKAGSWLAAMHEREPELVEIDGLEFREVFSVTMAEGGIANNVLPANLHINLNYRFPPIYSLEEAEERLQAVAAEADWIVIKDRAPSGEVVEHNVHLDRLLEISGASRSSKQGWTDVARLTARGIPAVNFGPGDPGLAHQQAESVPLVNVDRGYEVLREFLVDGQEDSSAELAELLADEAEAED